MGRTGIGVTFGAPRRELLEGWLRFAREHRQADRGLAPRAARPPFALAIVITLVVLVSGCGGGGGGAATVSSNLGAPTSDVPDSYQGLDGFTRVRGVAQRSGKVRVVLFQTLWDSASAVGPWEIVKALDQFGTWSGLRSGLTTVPYGKTIWYHVGPRIFYPPVATFDLSQARYRSAYVAFTQEALQVRPHTPERHLPPPLAAEFARYSHLHEHAFPEDRYATPTVVVGAYAMHGPSVDANNLMPGYPSPGPEPKSETFAGLQKMFQKGDSTQFWVVDFNAYVNVVVALICHQDGGRPARVCSRPAIRTILKRVR